MKKAKKLIFLVVKERNGKELVIGLDLHSPKLLKEGGIKSISLCTMQREKDRVVPMKKVLMFVLSDNGYCENCEEPLEGEYEECTSQVCERIREVQDEREEDEGNRDEWEH